MKLKKLKDVLSMADWIGFKTPILFVHASKEDNRVAFKIWNGQKFQPVSI